MCAGANSASGWKRRRWVGCCWMTTFQVHSINARPSWLAEQFQTGQLVRGQPFVSWSNQAISGGACIAAAAARPLPERWEWSWREDRSSHLAAGRGWICALWLNAAIPRNAVGPTGRAGEAMCGHEPQRPAGFTSICCWLGTSLAAASKAPTTVDRGASAGNCKRLQSRVGDLPNSPV